MGGEERALIVVLLRYWQTLSRLFHSDMAFLRNGHNFQFQDHPPTQRWSFLQMFPNTNSLLSSHPLSSLPRFCGFWALHTVCRGFLADFLFVSFTSHTQISHLHFPLSE